jgi:hypothetical protein
MMHVQLTGDDADAPLLDVVVAEDLGLDVRWRDHESGRTNGSALCAVPRSRSAVSGTVIWPRSQQLADQALGAAIGTQKQPG